MAKNNPITINHQKILVVEGNDEDTFFGELLAVCQINDIQIHNANGKDNIKNAITVLTKTNGFESVTSIAIIRDADDDHLAAFQSCVDSLSSVELQPPGQCSQFGSGTPRAGVFVLPKINCPGMLEDLLMETVSAHPVIPCVDNFMACVQSANTPNPQNPAKARAKAFLAGMENSVPHVGVAATHGYWDLTHTCLDDLKVFLHLL
uniref:DUF4435 domain-containing protein n=1 Tax=mine drainage metagenome TaxID=410659 RepID=E6QQR9_9ZZZZ